MSFTGGTPPGTIKVLDDPKWPASWTAKIHTAIFARIAEKEARLCLLPLPLRILAHFGLWEPWW